MSISSVSGPSMKLPAGWSLQSLGDVLKVRNGFAFKSSDYQTSGVLLIRQSNLGGNRVSLEKAEYLPERFLKDHADFRIAKGDMLIGMSGSIGKLCVYDRDEPALQNQRTGLLKFKDGSLKRWIWHYLPLIESKLHEGGKGVGVQNISASQIEALPIPIAPEEQRVRIVAEIEKQFSRLDEAVASLKRTKANLKRYKAAVLKAAVEGKLTEDWRKQHLDVEPASKILERILAERRARWNGKGRYKESKKPDTGELPAIPESWIWTTVDQLTWMVTSGSRGWGDYYSDTGPLFIRAQDIKTDSLNLETVARVRIPKNAEGTRTAVAIGDVLITITGANVTKSALVSRLSEQAFVSQHVALLKPCLTVVSPFLFYWVVSPAHGRRTLEGLAYGAGKPGLSLEQVRSLPVALPPLAEQEQIVAEVERRLSVIEELEATVEANLTRAECLRQAILSKAFSGELLHNYA